MASTSEASGVKQHNDDSAIQLDEEHPVDLSVWMSQYTYYYEEHVKGIVTLKVKDVHENAARVCVVFWSPTRLVSIPRRFSRRFSILPPRLDAVPLQKTGYSLHEMYGMPHCDRRGVDRAV